MKFEWGYLFGMALQTVPEPRKVARDLLAWQNAPHALLWQVLALLLVGSTWLKVLGSMLFPVDPAMAGPLLSDPIMMGIAEASSSILTVFILYWMGRAFGGTGSFGGAIIVVSWMQFVLLIVELGVLFFSVFAPGFAVLLWVMGLIMTFWILSHFTAELHGFGSAGMVFVGILMTLMGLVVLMTIVLSLIGFGMVPPESGAS